MHLLYLCISMSQGTHEGNAGSGLSSVMEDFTFAICVKIFKNLIVLLLYMLLFH